MSWLPSSCSNLLWNILLWLSYKGDSYPQVKKNSKIPTEISQCNNVQPKSHGAEKASELKSP